MNVVASCGWLEYFAEGPNASFFAPARRVGEAQLPLFFASFLAERKKY
ncbi:MAG: hypothetical protein NTU83_00265 [Candidatus Hydrogenedentes bacterium]|nr:hypothetical protein [Candidatus Hydrogenedentota bacterium]